MTDIKKLREGAEKMRSDLLANLDAKTEAIVAREANAAWRDHLATHPEDSRSTEKQTQIRRLTEALVRRGRSEARREIDAMFAGMDVAYRTMEEIELRQRVPVPVRFSMGVLNLLEWVLPKRIVAEDLGDTMEKLARLERSGASRWKVVATGLAGAFWLALNGIRHVMSSVRGEK